MFAVVSLDVMAVDGEWTAELRRRAASGLGIPETHIAVAATHTHSGTGQLLKFAPPLGDALRAIFGESEGRFDPVLYEYTLRRTLEALGLAHDAMRPARASLASDTALDIASDRTDAGAAIDSTCTVIRIVERDSPRVIAALMHFTCHPTVLGDADTGISADFPGVATSIVELAAGPDGVALFLNGSLGNVSTRFTRQAVGYSEVQRMGSVLGGAGQKALNSTRGTPLDGPLTAEIQTVELAAKSPEWFRGAAGRAEGLRAELVRAEGDGAPHSSIRQLKTALQGAEIACALEPHMNGVRTVQLPLQRLSFGDQLTLLAVPAEVFSTLAQEVESAAGSYCRVIGPANGYLGYLPDATRFASGGDEADASLFAADAGAQFTSAARAMVSQTHTPK